jgi:uncharacterized FlgJ-related protein
VVRSIRYLVIKKEEDNSHFTRFYDVNTYLQEVKNLCLMQVSHKAQPDKENVAEHYVLSKKKRKKVFLNKLNSYLTNNSNKLQDMRSPIFSIQQESFHAHMRLIRFHVILCP